MSRTYEIGCDQCGCCVWIGQAHAATPREFHIYKDNARTMVVLDQWLMEHLGHPLRFMDSEERPEAWVEIEPYPELTPPSPPTICL